MLILTRKRGESIWIDGRIKITIVEMKGNQVRVGVEAPQEYKVYREEIYEQILDENRQAAEAAMSGLDGLSQALGSRGDKEATPQRSSFESLSKMPVSRSNKVDVTRKRKKGSDADE